MEVAALIFHYSKKNKIITTFLNCDFLIKLRKTKKSGAIKWQRKFGHGLCL